MPVHLPIDASDEDLLVAVRGWVLLLEQEQYQEAFDYTYQDSYHEWTPDLIRDVIYGYGVASLEPEQPVYKVTSISMAAASDVSPYAEIDFHMPRPHWLEGTLSVAEIWFSLPLNGTWSDLTATFNVLYMPNGVSLELQEIHVF